MMDGSIAEVMVQYSQGEGTVTVASMGHRSIFPRVHAIA